MNHVPSLPNTTYAIEHQRDILVVYLHCIRQWRQSILSMSYPIQTQNGRTTPHTKSMMNATAAPTQHLCYTP